MRALEGECTGTDERFRQTAPLSVLEFAARTDRMASSSACSRDACPSDSPARIRTGGRA
jgi:hypothetical protein